MWWAIHVMYRWDGDLPHVMCEAVNEHSTLRDAQKDTVSLLTDYAASVGPEIEPTPELIAVAEAGKAFWKWEWERKGNGDLFIAMEAPKTIKDTITLLDNIDDSIRDDAHVIQ